MNIRLGYGYPKPTPMILTLNLSYSPVSDLVAAGNGQPSPWEDLKRRILPGLGGLRRGDPARAAHRYGS